MKYAIFALSMISTAAMAQDYNLTVTPQDIGIIGTALGDRPYREAMPLIRKLNEQIAAQDTERNKAAEDAKKPPQPSPPEQAK
jgi:hypothetical protein